MVAARICALPLFAAAMLHAQGTTPKPNASDYSVRATVGNLTLAAEYPVRLICRATGWPRSSVYHEAASSADESRLRRALGRLAARWPTYDTPKTRPLTLHLGVEFIPLLDDLIIGHVRVLRIPQQCF